MNSATSAIELFLDSSATEGGPFGLLGLPVGLHDESRIVESLRSRVRQIDAHPQSSTPAADEVRLALHAAAAQLLDPGIQRRLVERWQLSASRDDRSAPSMDPMLAMSLMGGWTPQSLRRLAVLAQAQNMPVERMVQAISQRAGYGPAIDLAEPQQVEASASPDDAPSQRDESDHEISSDPKSDGSPGPTVALFLGGAIAVLALIGISLYILKPAPVVVSTPNQQSLVVPQPITPPVQPATVEPSSVHDEVPEIDLSVATEDELLNRLDAAVGAVGFGAMAAVEDAGPAITALSQRWLDLSPGALARANGLVLELIYATAAWPDANRELARMIAAPAQPFVDDAVEADDVIPAVWSAGVLARLATEPDLPSRTAFAIDVSLRAATGASGQSVGGFGGGTTLMVARMPAAIAGANPTAWDRWIDVVQRVTEGDANAQERLLLAGLEALGRSDSDGVVDPIDRVTGAIDWSEAGLARPWLVRALLVPSTRSLGLHAVTAGVARRALAGFDLGMVLSKSASEYERRELAVELAKLWSLEQIVDTGAVSGAWLQRLNEAQLAHDAASTDIEQLASAVRLARLSEAASLRWRGANGQATTLLATLDDDIVAIIDARGTGGRGVLATEDDWGLQFLRAERDPRLRMRLLSSVASRRSIGTMSAEVLVAEALRGATRPTRDAARTAVVALASNVTIVNALLEELPRTRPSRVAAELIEPAARVTLPAPSDPEWMLTARRALVEQLLQLVASRSDRRAFDDLSALLAESYQNRLVVSASTGVTFSAEAAAMMLRSELVQQARDAFVPTELGFGLADIESIRTTRLNIASGPPQRFMAHQYAAVMLLGIIVVSEQPGRIGDVVNELRELDRARQQAESILQQIASAEVVMARLWGLRLEEPLP